MSGMTSVNLETVAISLAAEQVNKSLKSRSTCAKTIPSKQTVVNTYLEQPLLMKMVSQTATGMMVVM